MALSWRRAERRGWIAVLGLLSVTILVTAGYHLPANFRIWSGSLTDLELATELSWWLAAHALRVAFALWAGGVALLASKTPGEP
ncbi:MAG: hypothetical protein AAGA48_24875 [Myxococcota bacterium]